jgi:hypothetical protein
MKECAHSAPPTPSHSGGYSPILNRNILDYLLNIKLSVLSLSRSLN